MQPIQKNINYGTITAGGNVHIGDKIYVVEHDFQSSILFLRIDAVASGYEAMLSVKSSNDESIPLFRETVQLPIHDDLFRQVEEFQSLRRGVDGTMRRNGLADWSPENWESTLTEALYKTFFSGDIGTVSHDFFDLLQTNKINELLLVVSTEDERIQNLPWEIILPKLTPDGGYDLPKNSFGLIRSRIKTVERFNRQGPTVEAAPLKMLFIPALPENLPERGKLLEIENEQRKIIEAVRSLEATGDLQPKLVMEILDCANLDEITEALKKRSHDIVHISGHGAYVDAIKAGVLYLEDEDGNEQQTTGEQLGQALRQFASIKLLVLSACETAVGGSTGSTAEQMASVGLPAVLAMRFSVTDDGARLFTETFYTRLASGDPLTKAMHDARLVLWNYVQKQRTDAPQLFTPAEWFTPVLYQNQAIGPMLKPGQYNRDTLGRFYPQTPFLAGKHTRLIGEGFIGRKRLLIQLRHCFQQGKHVCLHGLGGLGKTTTAEAFAELYRKRNGHNILIFRAGTQIQEAVILERIFEHWKVVTKPDEYRAQQLKVQLDDPANQPTDKLQLLLDNCFRNHRNILIFDNFEDVQTDQDGAQQQAIGSDGLRTFVRYLLENAPHDCHILVTTRYPISDLTDLVTHLAVDKMTYAEQYRYVNFSETLRKLSAPERAILDRRIDGHPRALELLEGNLRKSRAFDLSQFDIEVGKVETKIFETLLLDRLYVQLSQQERDVFTTASVFFNRSPLMALSTVLNKAVEKLIPIIVSLRDWSLCFWDENEQTFEVHALTRAWMRKQQQPGQDRFKVLSHQTGVFFRKQPTTGDLFLAKGYFEQAEAWKDYASVSSVLSEHYELVGLYSLALDLGQEILNKNISPGNNANALCMLGQICFKQGNYSQALIKYEKSLNSSQESNDIVIESRLLTNIGQVYATMGKYNLAEKYFKESLKIAFQENDLRSVGIIYHNLGQFCFDTKQDTNQALRYYLQSLSYRQRVNDRRGQSMTFNNIGQVYATSKEYNHALRYLEASLKLAQEIGDVKQEGNTLINIASVYHDKGDLDQALRIYKDSYDIATKIGDKRLEGNTLNNIGRIYLAQNAYDDAFRNFFESLYIRQQIGDRRGEADVLEDIGRLYLRAGNSQQASLHFEECLKVRQQIGDINGTAQVSDTLGLLYFHKLNLVEKAIPLLMQAYDLYQKIGSLEKESSMAILNIIKEIIGQDRFDQIVHSIRNNSKL